MTPLSEEMLALLATVPLLVGAAGGALSRPVARRLDPAMATVFLTALALTVALVTGLLLCLIGTVGLAQVPLLAGLGHWSPDAMRARISIHPVACLIGGLVATWLLGAACAHLVRVIVRMRRTSVVVAALPAARDLVVLDDECAFAYAVPGRRSRIVVSTSMLERLTAPERRVLLAHEAAHLRRRHYLYVQLGRLAASANPLMRPVSRSIDLAVERWADEDAAREIGDRTAAARALAAAALAQTPSPAPEGSLAGTQTDMLERVASLLRPPVSHRGFAAFAAVIVLVCWIAGGLVFDHIHGLMELAEPIG